MANILSTLVEKEYRLSESEIDTLISSITSADKVGAKLTEGYFNVLQRRFVSLLKHSKEDEALKAAHDELYARVLASVAKDPDVQDQRNDTTDVRVAKAKERNRRSNFARTARQAIANIIAMGIEVPEWQREDLVTKSTLSKLVSAERSKSTLTTEDRATSAWLAFRRTLDKLYAEDSVQALRLADEARRSLITWIGSK